MAGQHLIGWGLPSLRRTVAVQWDSKVPPTDKNDPWRFTLRQSSFSLSPVDCRSPCCVDAMGVAGVSSPGVVRGVLVCGVSGC